MSFHLYPTDDNVRSCPAPVSNAFSGQAPISFSNDKNRRKSSKSSSGNRKDPNVPALFESSDRIGDDLCAQRTRVRDNAARQEYQLQNLRASPGNDLCETRDKIDEFASRYRNLRPWTGYGVSECEIDVDSHIRNEKIWTSDPNKIQYLTRTFQAVPQLWRGVPMPETEARLQNGQDTSISRREGALSETQFPVFHPTVAPVSTEHVIPDWTRGGESSRGIAKSPEFLSDIGYKYDSDKKIWIRSKK